MVRLRFEYEIVIYNSDMTMSVVVFVLLDTITLLFKKKYVII